MKIKTIDVNCKEWFDKINGNSYFAGTVTINYGMKSEKVFNLPHQYGYGSQYQFEAFKQLEIKGYIKKQDSTSYWNYYRDNKIIARHSLQTNCKKRELKEY